MWMIDSLLQIIFPARCMGCGVSKVSLCTRCILLARKSLNPVNAYTASLFDFKDPLIKRAIHSLKYYRRKDILPPLATALASEVGSVLRANLYTLIPIPMPTMRKLLRGHNQAELLAQYLGEALTLTVDSKILVRTRGLKRQTTMRRKQEREANQRGSFSVQGAIDGKRFCLVDDVTTTGATLDEARKTLLSHGAQEVIAVTLAH